MVKQIDDNGFWEINDNPISKAGVFPYLGKQISSELEPDKIYMVYRPKEELTNEETIKSFQAIPFQDEHEMIGEGFTPYDERKADGVLYDVHATDNGLSGSLKIYSEDLKDKIKSGKKELSLGYLCRYELNKGVFDGQEYDAIQRDIRGNHIALVNRGRMGSEVRVYDRAITMDAMDIPLEDYDNLIPQKGGTPKKSGVDSSLISNNGDNKMADKREAIREVMAIAAKPDSEFQGGEEEKIETIAKILEQSEYSKSETGTANDEKDEPSSVLTTEPVEETKEDEKKDALDAMPQKILKMISERNEIVKKVEPLIGAFACDSMTPEEVAHYACQKLGLSASEADAKAVLSGYMAAQKENKVFGLDSAPQSCGVDKATERYLKGE